MRDRLRLGLIGTGGISHMAHIPAWQRVQGVAVVAIAEPVPERRESAARLLAGQTGQGVTAYADWREMLGAAHPDLVDITIPAGPAKVEAVKGALEAGCHVTCQKPFALNLESAAALTQLAAERGRVLSVNQQARYAGAFRRLRQWIEEGRLGSLRTIQLYADFPNAGDDQWLQYSVHSFDLIRFWASTEPQRVMAWQKAQTPDGRDLLTVWLDFDGRLAAHVWDEMSSSTMLRWGFRLMGDRGTARGHEAFGSRMMPAEIVFTPAGALSETVEPITTPYLPDAFAAYFDALVHALRGEGPVPTPAEDNLKTLQLAFAARRAAAAGAWVEVGR